MESTKRRSYLLALNVLFRRTRDRKRPHLTTARRGRSFSIELLIHFLKRHSAFVFLLSFCLLFTLAAASAIYGI